MRTWPNAVVALLFATGCVEPPEYESEVAEVTPQIDGAELVALETNAQPAYADYMARDDASIILMFHQAGSNAVEYEPIAEWMAQTGYSCLAVNLRSGAEQFGANNPTATQYEEEQAYPLALEDMRAALDWADTRGYENIFVWGSSYSASLVFKLAGDYPGLVDAVLAFSPGEYFDDDDIVREWADQVTQPVLVAAAEGEGDARLIYESAVDANFKVYVEHEGGVHGSSAAREDRNPDSSDQYRSDVLQFLDRVESYGPPG
ncbi:MAG: alpha/beta hydrolase [Fimbriimonadaceae bacterium]